ncbi:MAG: P-loop NTPase [Proteobacteria bacterium]|nr:P-loop NTPase [Pseudomonadota bacterium]
MNAPRITAIGSGKGGTGKTLIAVSLAHALAHEGERVLLCDADLGLSNAAVHLGLDDGGNLPAVMRGACAVADAIVPVLGGAGKRGGFDLLSAPAGSGALANSSQEDARRLLIALSGADNYDRILLDLGAGVDNTTMMFAAAADEAVLVMTPDPSALTDAYAFTKLLNRADSTRLPLVLVNVALSEGEAQKTFDALAATARAFLKCAPDYLGGVPRDPKANDAVRRQCHLLTLYPQAPASRAIEGVARALHDHMPQKPSPVLRASMR